MAHEPGACMTRRYSARQAGEMGQRGRRRMVVPCQQTRAPPCASAHPSDQSYKIDLPGTPLV